MARIMVDMGGMPMCVDSEETTPEELKKESEWMAMSMQDLREAFAAKTEKKQEEEKKKTLWSLLFHE